MPAATVFAYVIWVVFLCQPEWAIAGLGVQPMVRVPAPLVLLLALLALARYPATRWYVPLLAVVALAVATTPLSSDLGLTLQSVRRLGLFWCVSAGILTLVRTPRQAQFIVMALMLYSYVWWVANGAWPGQVRWHPELVNYDGFGPLMVGGAAMTGFAALAIQNRLRWLALATSLLCVVGLVSSFTRGAFLAAGAVLLFAWYRSPRKGAMTAGAILIVAVVGIVGSTTYANVSRQDNATSFFARIGTITENVNTGSGLDRKTIWRAAWHIFLQHPVVGVGFAGFGPTAARTFQPGSSLLTGQYAANPSVFYDKALHNGFYQVLCEQGLLGSMLWLWLLIDFWKRNLALREEGFRRAWAAETGGSLDLRFVALGLEAGMVGYLACSYFYNLLTSEWFFGMLIANRLLHHVLVPRVQVRPGAAGIAHSLSGPARFRRSAR